MFARIRETLKGWKTVIVNAAVGLPAGLYTLYLALAEVNFTPVIPAQYVAGFMVFWAVLGILLRLVTTGPVGSKGEEPATPATKAGD
jgi:hypothetical protein